MAALRSLLVPGVAICCAFPVSAQQAPQQVVQAVNATNTSFVQDWNKHDPAAMAGKFTPNALFVAPSGSFVGREGVQQFFEKFFATVHPALDFTHDIDRAEMLSNDLVVVTGHFTLSNPRQRGFGVPFMNVGAQRGPCVFICTMSHRQPQRLRAHLNHRPQRERQLV